MELYVYMHMEVSYGTLCIHVYGGILWNTMYTCIWRYPMEHYVYKYMEVSYGTTSFPPPSASFCFINYSHFMTFPGFRQNYIKLAAKWL